MEANAADVIHIDDPFTSRGPDLVAQQLLPVLDWAAPQVVTVKMQQVEGEVGEPVVAAFGYGLAEPVDMGDAAVGREPRSPRRAPSAAGRLSCGRAPGTRRSGRSHYGSAASAGRA